MVPAVAGRGVGGGLAAAVVEKRPGLIGRFLTYQRERFPLVAYVPLVLVFTFSAAAYSRLLRQEPGFISWLLYGIGSLTALVFFFLLRVLDEHKDVATDRAYRPELVLTHQPLRSLTFPIGASHPDHLATGQAALAAVYPDARNPRAFRQLLGEGLPPHHVAEVWIPGHEHTDLYVDVSPFAERKVEAIWAAIARARETGDWRPNPSALCRWCAHQSICPEFGGTPPPLPPLPSEGLEEPEGGLTTEDLD